MLWNCDRVQFACCARRWGRISPPAWGTVRARALLVGFSHLQMQRDHALGDIPSPIVWETRSTSQTPGSSAAHVPGASFWPSCRKRLHSVKRGVECTSGAVRARTKFEETREVEEEALTMPSSSVDMEHFRPYSSLWNGVFAT